MATVTPNFNWPVPTSTDLVKDGATAIEALGDSIDASLVDLKGGTTGQVLSKASNTDMDFTWVTNADGDITGVTAGTGLTGGGTSGTVTLAVDPTYAGFTNLNYLANPVLNSAFQVAQRGTSIALAANTRGYTLDRWDAITAANNACVISRQATGDTTNLPNIQYALRYQRNSGQTGTGAVYLANSFETINSIPFAGKTVTFSFYARRGANYSGSSNILPAVLATGTGTDQAILGGYTGTLEPIQINASLTTTWQRFSGTGTLSSSLNELSIYFGYTPSGTAGANDYYEVTGVQIDIGSVALPFRTNGPTYEAELAACQRYYWRSSATGGYSSFGIGSNPGTAGSYIQIENPVTMRTITSVEWANLGIQEGGDALKTATSVTIDQSSLYCIQLSVGVSSGLTTYRAVRLLANNNSSAYLAINGEL
jgi:hypothetical protein